MNQALNLLVISGYVSGGRNRSETTWLKSVIKNHVNYCFKHNYSYKFCTNYSKPASLVISNNLFHVGSWSKPKYILEELKSNQYDYIFWMDPDSIFTNFNISLDDLIYKNKDLTFAGDYSDVFNGGHLLVKNTDFSRYFISLWDDSRFINFSNYKDKVKFELTEDGYAIGDQTLFNALLNNPTLDPVIIINSFNIINGFEGNDIKKFPNWKDLYLDSDYFADNVLNNLINDKIKDYIYIVPQKRLNSYLDYDHKKVRYTSGDPILHFVSTSKKHLEKRNFLINRLIENGIYIKPFYFKIKEIIRYLKNEFY